MTPHRPLRLVATGLVAGVVLAGCGGPSPSGTVVPPALLTPSSSPATVAPTPTPTPTPVASTATPTRPPAALELVAWGGTGRLLSLVVRNVGRREIRSASVRIALYDSTGRLVRRTTGPRRSTCCTILRLPPGRRFGLFVNLRRPADDIARVTVRFATVRTGPWPRPGSARITVRDARLVRTRDDAIVTATVSAHGPLRPYIVGQAFLTDRRGRLRAVISGRFYCFRNGTTRQLRMQLLHPVPRGTRIGTVLGYPVPVGQPTLVRGSCS